MAKPTVTSAGATGTPGVPCNAPDVRTGNYDGDGDNDTENAGNTANQPRPTPPPGSSTNNQPRPEDFMSSGGEY